MSATKEEVESMLELLKQGATESRKENKTLWEKNYASQYDELINSRRGIFFEAVTEMPVYDEDPEVVFKYGDNDEIVSDIPSEVVECYFKAGLCNN